MNPQTLWEIIGYLGSVLVLVSLLMSSVIKLRIINTIGSLIFCIYAFKINSIPTALMNLALVFINLYFLYKLLSTKKTFRAIEVTADDSAVRYLTELCREDIQKYFGAVDLKSADVLLMVYHKETIAGLTAGKAHGDKLELLMDYTTPAYRDSSVGKHVNEVLSKRFRCLSYAGSNEAHISYVLKMGYTQENGEYIKKL